MKDRVPLSPGRVLITPEDGSAPYHATLTRADEPTQVGDPLNKATFLKDATAALYGLTSEAVPDDVFQILSGIKRFKKLAEYKTAGAFTFVVPDGISLLAAFIVGGGQGGQATASNAGLGAVSGGNSGGLNAFIGAVTPGQEINGVVGAGGSGGQAKISSTGTSNQIGGNGGTSSFYGVTALGGMTGIGTKPILAYGSADILYGLNQQDMSFMQMMRAMFFDLYIQDPISYFCAGSSVYSKSSSTLDIARQERITFPNGNVSSLAAVTKSGGSARATTGTDPGCGGGAAAVGGIGYTATSSAGAPGAVAIFGC